MSDADGAGPADDAMARDDGDAAAAASRGGNDGAVPFGDAWAWAADAGAAAVASAVARRWEAAATAPDEGSVRDFDGDSTPPISVGDYTQRFVQFANPGIEGLVLALVLTERLESKTDGSLQLTMRNVHRVAAAALLVAGKLALERYYSNVRVAKVAGLAPSDLNALERALLSKLEYDVSFTPEALAERVARLREEAELDGK